MKKILILCILLFICLKTPAARLYPEKYYQNAWCSQWRGMQEFELKNHCRVDCVTKNYAVEFEFASKWAEAVGQSLYYAKQTGKRAAIILILESKKDWVYYNRLKSICPEHGITLWYIVSPNFD